MLDQEMAAIKKQHKQIYTLFICYDNRYTWLGLHQSPSFPSDTAWAVMTCPLLPSCLLKWPRWHRKAKEHTAAGRAHLPRRGILVETTQTPIRCGMLSRHGQLHHRHSSARKGVKHYWQVLRHDEPEKHQKPVRKTPGYMNYLEQKHPQKQELGQWLLEDRREPWKVTTNRHIIAFGGDDNVLKLQSGNDHTTLKIN